MLFVCRESLFCHMTMFWTICRCQTNASTSVSRIAQSPVEFIADSVIAMCPWQQNKSESSSSTASFNSVDGVLVCCFVFGSWQTWSKTSLFVQLFKRNSQKKVLWFPQYIVSFINCWVCQNIFLKRVWRGIVEKIKTLYILLLVTMVWIWSSLDPVQALYGFFLEQCLVLCF